MEGDPQPPRRPFVIPCARISLEVIGCFCFQTLLNQWGTNSVHLSASHRTENLNHAMAAQTRVWRLSHVAHDVSLQALPGRISSIVLPPLHLSTQACPAR